MDQDDLIDSRQVRILQIIWINSIIQIHPNN